MKTTIPLAAAAAAFALFLAAPASAGSSPVGTWQTAKGDARYQVAMCEDGKSLCAKLTWLRSDKRTPKNLKYLNKWVVKARPAGDNTWKGTVNIHGDNASGKLTMVNASTMKVEGCKAVFCKSLQFRKI